MRVREGDRATRALSNVRDREQRLDRIRAHVPRELRARSSMRFEERADRVAFVQREAPTIGVGTLRATA